MSIAETRAYYRGSSVVHRMLEFCGIPHEEAISFSVDGVPLSRSKDLYKFTKKLKSEFFVAFGGQLLRERGDEKEFVQNYGLGWMLDKGFDINRSLWDSNSTLGIIDMEYFSERYPGEVFAKQEDTFWKMEPLYQCLKDILMSYGIRPLTIATGQGYHFDFRVDKKSKVHRSLEEIAIVEDTLREKYRHASINFPRFRRQVTEQESRGFEGIGRLIEFIVHNSIRKSREYGVNMHLSVGEIPGRNEMRDGVNLDLSAFCSPLYMRAARIPFSSYHKHKVYAWKVGEDIARDIPVNLAIPRYTPGNNNELLMHELFNNRRNFHNTANYAGAVTAEIPESSEGVEKLIADYKRSGLFRFHQDFDSVQHDPLSSWPNTYDRYGGQDSYTMYILENPAPALLKPTNIKHLTRRLMGEGWHPKHIGGLLRSKYERDHGWAKKEGGDYDFQKYDASAHANKWVRFYAGLISEGLDNKS